MQVHEAAAGPGAEAGADGDGPAAGVQERRSGARVHAAREVDRALLTLPQGCVPIQACHAKCSKVSEMVPCLIEVRLGAQRTRRGLRATYCKGALPSSTVKPLVIALL